MPPEHAILCGDVQDTKLPFGCENPVRLELDGVNANIDLRFDDLQVTLWKTIPPVLCDLVRLAAYVYAADQATARPDDDEGFTAGWGRRLFFRVPVREPDRWNSPVVRNRLTQTLAFLSGDEYAFEFVRDRQLRQLPLDFETTPFEGEVDEIALFSGGLDSLAGAVRTSVVERRKALLITHRSTQKVVAWQSNLARSLANRAGDSAPLFAHVRVNKSERLRAERTQRSRSFLFAALAAAFAGTMELDRIRFYENGVVSLNLPLSAQVVGSRATRTTHPRVLEELARLFSELLERPFAIENPFLWHTKTDVVRTISDADCGDLIGMSRSCAGTAKQSNDTPHCGLCSQCIDRRFAVLAADQALNDPENRYAVELFTGERSEGRPRAMLAAYLETAREVARSDAHTFFGKFGEAARALRHVGIPAETAAKQIFELYQRHAGEVLRVLTQGIARHADRMVERDLPHSCLIRIVTSVSEPTDEGSSPNPNPNPTDVPLANDIFRLRGHFWEVRFKGGPVNYIERCRGASYFHKLLVEQGNGMSAANLAATVTRTRHGLPPGESGERSDRDSLAAYRARIQELDEEIAKAEKDKDFTALDLARREREDLLRELQGSLGFQGRILKEKNDRDRVRRAVYNAFDRLAKEFAKLDPALAQHLRNPQFLRRGHNPCYTPPVGVEWLI